MSKKMIKKSLIYAGGDVINKAVPFLMLPVLTKYLTPCDYGMIAAFSSFVGFLTIFIGLSLHGAINVAFFKLKKEALRVYIANALLILGISATISLLAVFFLDTSISQKLLLEKEWLYIAVVVSISQFITLINTTLWIAEQNPKSYSIYQISQTVLITTLTVLLVIGLGLGWEGQVMAMVIGYISFAMVSVVFLQKRDYLRFGYRKEDIRDLLKFGIPMIPHQLSGWIRTSGDKILLIAMVGSASTGLFTVGYQVAMIMTLLTTAFNKAWNPYLYELLNQKDNDESKIKIVKLTYIYFVSIIILFVLLYFISELIFEYLLDDKFLDSMEFVVYILLANTFNGMYLMVSSYLFYTKETKRLAKITFSISIVHIILSYLFIMLFGAIGAAYSGVVSMFLIFVLVWYSSNSVYSMPWGLWRLNDR